MDDAPTLFDPGTERALPPYARPSLPPWMTLPLTPLERAFLAFHTANPQVYAELERLALDLRRKRPGLPRIGIAMLYETMRYNMTLRTEGDAFKLNNNWKALYARLFLWRHPEFVPVIELRERREGP